MELKTLKRLSETKVAYDGIIWTTDSEKATEITNNETGCKLHSIKVYGTYYYPYSIDNRKKK